jgi:hypothetical protein
LGMVCLGLGAFAGQLYRASRPVRTAWKGPPKAEESDGDDTSSTTGIGVLGLMNNGNALIGIGTSTNSIGVEGGSDGAGGFGIYGYGFSGGSFAGWFQGDVNVTGNLSKSGGSFKIDDPLDPANKYLYHSFVESPDMKDMYDGTVTTDVAGNATIQLPKWFQALNRSFR